MSRNRGNHDIASTVRGAFLRAAKMAEDDGRPLSMILLDLLTSDPKGCLDTVAKFVPKEMLIEATITQQLDDLTDEALELEIERLAGETATALIAASEAGQAKH